MDVVGAADGRRVAEILRHDETDDASLSWGFVNSIAFEGGEQALGADAHADAIAADVAHARHLAARVHQAVFQVARVVELVGGPLRLGQAQRVAQRILSLTAHNMDLRTRPPSRGNAGIILNKARIKLM